MGALPRGSRNLTTGQTRRLASYLHLHRPAFLAEFLGSYQLISYKAALFTFGGLETRQVRHFSKQH